MYKNYIITNWHYYTNIQLFVTKSAQLRSTENQISKITTITSLVMTQFYSILWCLLQSFMVQLSKMPAHLHSLFLSCLCGEFNSIITWPCSAWKLRIYSHKLCIISDNEQICNPGAGWKDKGIWFAWEIIGKALVVHWHCMKREIRLWRREHTCPAH